MFGCIKTQEGPPHNQQSTFSQPPFPLGPPGPPGVVIVEEITDSTATLSWTRGLDNHSPISTYNLQARSPFSLGWQTVKTGKSIQSKVLRLDLG